jgi:hypothetical protein
MELAKANPKNAILEREICGPTQSPKNFRTKKRRELFAGVFSDNISP